jgi:hypothetical protein
MARRSGSAAKALRQTGKRMIVGRTDEFRRLRAARERERQDPEDEAAAQWKNPSKPV